MNGKVLIAATIASLALGGPAMAFESSGTIQFQSLLGDGTSTFSQSFDPRDGNFSRTGHITLSDGKIISYSLNGTCEVAQKACDFTGSATGPMGGQWRAKGKLVRENDGFHLVGDLVRPDGKAVDFDRKVDRRLRALDHFFD